MDARWSDPRHVLGVVERLLSVPRADLYPLFTAELATLIPHRATAVRTADCARTPSAVAGDPSITAAVTSTELLHLARRTDLDGRPAAHGDAAGIGSTGGHTGSTGAGRSPAPEMTEAVLGGAVRRLVLLDSRSAAGGGSLLVVVPEETTPSPVALDLAARLWQVLSTDQYRRATEQVPGMLAGNLAAAAARARVIADLGQAHRTTLAALLAVLRSGRLADGVARRTATDLAAAALIDLSAVAAHDREMSAEPADAAFAVLEGQLAHLVRHVDMDISLVGPGTGEPVPQDIAHAARAITRALVLASIDRPATTRVRASWRVAGAALQITVRDDCPHDDTSTPGAAMASAGVPGAGDTGAGGPGDGGAGEVAVSGMDPAGDVALRLAALRGTWEIDAVPGWGTTVSATLPLAAAVAPATASGQPIGRLNARELEVLDGIARGLRNRAIAAELRLSEHTVKFHVRNLLEKLGVTSRGEAAALVRVNQG